MDAKNAMKDAIGLGDIDLVVDTIGADLITRLYHHTCPDDPSLEHFWYAANKLEEVCSMLIEENEAGMARECPEWLKEAKTIIETAAGQIHKNRHACGVPPLPKQSRGE